MSFFILITVFLGIFSNNVQADRFGCLNGVGQTVDWWVIYKEGKGVRYVYLDSTMNEPLGLDSLRTLNGRNSPLSLTIRSANYFARSSLSAAHINIAENSHRHKPAQPFYVSWNDQLRKGASVSTGAHAKGFMGLKNTSRNVVESFFIQHSLPRFPYKPSQLYDTNIDDRAQHFFCISMKDEFTGQKSKDSLIDPEKLKESNFFKILWNYASVIKVKSLQESNLRFAASFRNVFKALTNDLNDGTKMLSSFLIKSAGINAESISIHVTAKSPDNHIDIYDDVTSLLSIHHDDYNGSQHLKTGHPLDDKVAMLMITQSHTDPATLGINQKVLIDRRGRFATVHILNSAYIDLPVEGSHEPYHQPSMYSDHSKWSVNVIYGSEGSFPATLCFYDLNRSNKQTHRGGGAFCLNSSFTRSSPGSVAIWNMFMSFSPKPTDMARFKNSPIEDILSQINPNTNHSSPLPLNTATPRRSRSRSGSFKRTKSAPPITRTPNPFNLEDGTPAASSSIGTITEIAEDEETVDTTDVTDDSGYNFFTDDEEGTSGARNAELKSAEKQARKREIEDEVLSNIEMSYLKFSRDQVEESGKHIILILHQPSSKIYPRTFDIVPCPFRYGKDGNTVDANDKVPSLVGLKISNYYSQYGPEKLNELLRESFNLSISSTKFSGSPDKNCGNCAGYGSTVKVPLSSIRKVRSRSSSESCDEFERYNTSGSVSSDDASTVKRPRNEKQPDGADDVAVDDKEETFALHSAIPFGDAMMPTYTVSNDSFKSDSSAMPSDEETDNLHDRLAESCERGTPASNSKKLRFTKYC